MTEIIRWEMTEFSNLTSFQWVLLSIVPIALTICGIALFVTRSSGGK